MVTRKEKVRSTIEISEKDLNRIPAKKKIEVNRNPIK
jgi:hypothetical protein